MNFLPSVAFHRYRNNIIFFEFVFELLLLKESNGKCDGSLGQGRRIFF